VLAERRRDPTTLACKAHEDRERRAFENVSLRADEQRILGALLDGQPPSEHVRRVADRLDLVEQRCRRVNQRAQRHRMLRVRCLFMHPDPPAAAGDDEADQPRERSSRRKQRRDLRAHLAGIEIEAHPSCRALHPLDVLVERERSPVVDPDDLEDRITAHEARVGGRNRRRGDRHQLSIDDRKQLSHGRAPRAGRGRGRAAGRRRRSAEGG